MHKYSFKTTYLFKLGVGQHTTPADPGLPKPPCQTAHCVNPSVRDKGRVQKKNLEFSRFSGWVGLKKYIFQI